VRTRLSLAALAAGAALLLAAALHDGGPSLARVEAVEAAGTLAVEGRRFGDPVVGRLDVLVPNRQVDPESVSLDASFAPFALAAPPVDSRVANGGTTLVRYRFVLECLEEACLPRNVGDGLVLAPATVRFTERSGRPGSVTAGWPQVGAASWLGGDQGGLLGWRADLDPLPAFDYRLPPRLLALLLAVLAAATAATSFLLLRPWARGALPRPRAAGDGRSVLERALAAVRSAAGGDDPSERRRALDLLARELRQDARRQEARDARRLAWSRRAPRRTDMEELADRVERAEA
jgi:hypothetical protein